MDFCNAFQSFNQCPTSVFILVAVYDSLQKYNQLLSYCVLFVSFSALTLLVGYQAGHSSWDAVCSVFCTKSCTGWMFLTQCRQTLHNCSPVSTVQSSTVHDRMLQSDLRQCPSAASTVCQLPSAVRPASLSFDVWQSDLLCSWSDGLELATYWTLFAIRHVRLTVSGVI